MLKENKIQKVVIAGGGTAGWMAAAALSKLLGKNLDISLIESDEIGTVGVGEATIPTLQGFHRLLGINEHEFIQAVNGTFKLGIEFENWGAVGDSYIHSFGQTGKECWAAEFHHFWLKGLDRGFNSEFGDYCLELQAAKAGKFAISNKLKINYAYHLDATLYAKFLRKLAEVCGVKRIEGKINGVNTNATTGYIESVNLESGQCISGDIFIDCTGFYGLLIEQALHTGYEDWSHVLPCDSAVAVQTESAGDLIPYTRSIAHNSGWQWRIPLQHRIGNGLVYCSQYMTDERAKDQLINNVEGISINEPRVIKYRTGRRLKGWNKNCIALGLASGFVEPLESTSIHLIMSGIVRLMRMFPLNSISQYDIDEYNLQTQLEIEHVRDFITLHYHVTQRTDSPFWLYCKNMDIPKSLSHRISLFKETGRIFKAENELFRIDSWAQVMIGQGIRPQSYHPIVDSMGDNELGHFLKGIKSSVSNMVKQLPDHKQFLDQYCKPANPIN